MDHFRKLALVALFCIIVLGAQISRADEFVDDLDLEEAVRIAEEDLYQHRYQLSRMNQGLQQQEQKLEKTEVKEQQLLQELTEIDQRLLDDSALLVKLYKDMQVQKLKTLEKKAFLESTSEEKRILALQTQKRLAAYYRMGEIGVLNITFTSSSLPDLVNFHEYYRYMLRQDRELINKFRVKLTELQQARQAHIAEAKRLETALEDTKQQQTILAATKKSRFEIIEKLQVKKALYKEAASQLESSAQALIHDIEALEKEAKQAKLAKEEWMIATYPIEPHKKRKPAWLRGFGGHQKKLPPPVMGAVTKLFSDDISGRNTANFGINFKIRAEARIRAVFKGKVVHTGFVKGYGQLVIISHSDNYYTLTSSVNTITVKKGDLVEQGDEIGYISQHQARLQQDLHFEIRKKEVPLDPLDWLDLNYIIFTPELEAKQQKQ